MTLNFLVESARKNGSRVQTDALIRKFAAVSRQTVSADSNLSVSPVPPKDPLLWTKCGHLKKSGEQCFCTEFMSLCAKEKCPVKTMKLDPKTP